MISRAVILGLIVAGCGLLGTGIGQDEAVRRAAAESELGPPGLFNVYEGRYATGGESRRAWVVTLQGPYRSCDGPGIDEPPCRIVNAQEVHYIDFVTGDDLGGDLRWPIP